jgi:riboflavin kinase/FMN adenylyltransferase
VEIVYEGSPFPRLPSGTAVTIGAFDGVHRGHQALIAEARRLASERDCPSVVATFDRHPATVVRPDSAPRLLTDLRHKLELLGGTGADYTYVIRFDEDRSLEAPDEFIREILVDALRARVVIVGQDFHFGHRRRGDIALLSDVGEAAGFKVIGMGLVEVPDVVGPVSSTAVRAALGEGHVELAAAMLGRDFEVRGVVEHGDHRGRTIGFPTANVAVPGDMMLPGDGVYAGYYERLDGSVHPAAINIGRRPTFYDENGMRLLEAHLLDFDEDLYGEAAKVRFTKWLRGEVKFSGIDALVEQLERDVEITREASTG